MSSRIELWRLTLAQRGKDLGGAGRNSEDTPASVARRRERGGAHRHQSLLRRPWMCIHPSILPSGAAALHTHSLTCVHLHFKRGNRAVEAGRLASHAASDRSSCSLHRHCQGSSLPFTREQAEVICGSLLYTRTPSLHLHSSLRFQAAAARVDERNDLLLLICSFQLEN